MKKFILFWIIVTIIPSLTIAMEKNVPAETVEQTEIPILPSDIFTHAAGYLAYELAKPDSTKAVSLENIEKIYLETLAKISKFLLVNKNFRNLLITNQDFQKYLIYHLSVNFLKKPLLISQDLAKLGLPISSTFEKNFGEQTESDLKKLLQENINLQVIEAFKKGNLQILRRIRDNFDVNKDLRDEEGRTLIEIAEYYHRSNNRLLFGLKSFLKTLNSPIRTQLFR